MRRGQTSDGVGVGAEEEWINTPIQYKGKQFKAYALVAAWVMRTMTCRQ